MLLVGSLASYSRQNKNRSVSCFDRRTSCSKETAPARGQSCLQRLQPPASAADPICQGRAIDLDILPGEDLALPVKRQVIAVFGDQAMREKAGSGEAFGDRRLWGGHLVDGPAGPAACVSLLQCHGYCGR